MEAAQTLSPSQLTNFLLNIAPNRPIFIWGPPGIGKSSLVEEFATSVGMPCVSLLGSQLAPEDIIGVPRIVDGISYFCPPAQIARKEPFCLFLDELNACSQEVQKAFYSLINDKKIGEFVLPKGSIIIGAGNHAQDAAIVKPLSSALINRMLHLQLKASVNDWLRWAEMKELHPLVLEYIRLRSDHLWSKPQKFEEPFSSPRSWHILSDAIKSFRSEDCSEDIITSLSSGLLTPSHARQFTAFFRQKLRSHDLNAILKGELSWPEAPEDRDILYFLVQSFRAKLIKELPIKKNKASRSLDTLMNSAKDRLVQLSRISLELSQLVIAEDENGNGLPDWFLIEITRDLPRLVKKNVR